MHLKCRPHQEMQTYIFYEFDTQLLRLEVHAYGCKVVNAAKFVNHIFALSKLRVLSLFYTLCIVHEFVL